MVLEFKSSKSVYNMFIVFWRIKLAGIAEAIPKQWEYLSLTTKELTNILW
jgi:hypothetical protein